MAGTAEAAAPVAAAPEESMAQSRLRRQKSRVSDDSPIVAAAAAAPLGTPPEHGEKHEELVLNHLFGLDIDVN